MVTADLAELKSLDCNANLLRVCCLFVTSECIDAQVRFGIMVIGMQASSYDGCNSERSNFALF